jgi:hypothetical protein
MLKAVAAPVVAAIGAAGGRVVQDGTGTPMVRAVIAKTALPALEALAEVDEIALDSPMEPAHAVAMACETTSPTPTCNGWLGTLRVPSAHTLSLGTGEKICVKEQQMPDDFSKLSGIDGIASLYPDTSNHIRKSVANIRNEDIPLSGPGPWNCVAPGARIYVANWSGYTATGGVNKWCRDNGVRYLNHSWGANSYANGPQSNTDREHDWMAKNSPFILVLGAAGNWDEPEVGSSGCRVGIETTCHVINRGLNGLVVGGIHEYNTGTDYTDDSVVEAHTTWRNYDTLHDDYELPNTAAMARGNSVTGINYSGTSSATAQTTGVAALVGARDTLRFDPWPEMKRAVILATATQRVNTPIATNLPFAQDGKIGVGAVDAYNAVQLADPNVYYSPNTSTATIGRYAMTLSFSTDFDSNGWSTKRWRAFITGTAAKRLRVVVAWDGSPTCDSNGVNCNTANPLDGDIDLHVWKTSSSTFDTPPGDPACSSMSWDSSYEFCDIPVVGGETYVIVPKKLSNNASSTYFGIAWFQY